MHWRGSNALSEMLSHPSIERGTHTTCTEASRILIGPEEGAACVTHHESCATRSDVRG